MKTPKLQQTCAIIWEKKEDTLSIKIESQEDGIYSVNYVSLYKAWKEKISGIGKVNFGAFVGKEEAFECGVQLLKTFVYLDFICLTFFWAKPWVGEGYCTPRTDTP